MREQSRAQCLDREGTLGGGVYETSGGTKGILFTYVISEPFIVPRRLLPLYSPFLWGLGKGQKVGESEPGEKRGFCVYPMTPPHPHPFLTYAELPPWATLIQTHSMLQF